MLPAPPASVVAVGTTIKRLESHQPIASTCLLL